MRPASTVDGCATSRASALSVVTPTMMLRHDNRGTAPKIDYTTALRDFFDLMGGLAG